MPHADRPATAQPGLPHQAHQTHQRRHTRRVRSVLALTALAGITAAAVGITANAQPRPTATLTTSTPSPRLSTAAGTSLERWLPARADAMVSSAKSTTAFGTARSIQLLSSSTNTQYAYLSFTAPGDTPTNLTGAVLELYFSNAVTKPITVSLVPATTEALTWTTAPAPNATLGTIPSHTIGRVAIPLDVPSVMYTLAYWRQADGTTPLGLRLAGTTSTFYTREAGIPAKLHLTYSDPAPAQSNPAQMTWTPVATHPGAAAQPTTYGQAINTLTVWQNRLWSGYGDYGANTGPIALSALDPSSNQMEEFPRTVAAADELDALRPLGTRLWAPYGQPAVQSQTGKHAAFATGTGQPSEWGAITLPNALPDGTKPAVKHVLDAAQLPDGSLYIVGALGKYATVWRSGDGGTTWSISLTVAPVAGTDFARFYWAGVLNGKLYVQAYDINALKSQASSRVFNGTTWTVGPAIMSGVSPGFHPEEFNGKLVMVGTPGQPRYLTVFDGTTSRVINTLAVRNLTVDRTQPTPVLVLCCTAVTGGQVAYTTTDLVSFTALGPVMASGAATGNSIAVTPGAYNGRAYWIGDSVGRIWRFG